jgi:hypothetical protein
MVYEHLDDFLCQWEGPMVSILDKPFPSVLRISLGVDFNGLRIKINISPSAVQEFCTPHGSSQSDRDKQIPS